MPTTASTPPISSYEEYIRRYLPSEAVLPVPDDADEAVAVGERVARRTVADIEAQLQGRFA